MRPTLHEIFMATALNFAERSTCIRKKVGGVLVKDKRILCCGYNGVASGDTHCETYTKQLWESIIPENVTMNEFIEEYSKEKHNEYSTNFELHAEQNIISYCAKEGISVKDCTLYITLSPCIHCAKIIYASGIKNVYYYELYDRDQSGVEYLKKHGVIIEDWKVVNKLMNGE